MFRMRAASFLEQAEDEVRVGRARVLECRDGPNVLASDDHRMLLSEIRTDLVDGGLVRRVEFFRPGRLDRVLPRPLVPELHDPTPSGPRMRVTRIRFRLSVRIGVVSLRRVENLWDFRRAVRS